MNFFLDQLDFQSHEGGPNWEIFNPKGNRFYLPNSLGLGWQRSNSTIVLDGVLDDFIDFASTVCLYNFLIATYGFEFSFIS